jgi:cytochrome bd-type quinol oxidase subunit 2
MRPEAQLFLHILAATALFGSLLTVAALGLSGRGRAAFARAALITTLGFAVPAWVLMFAFGSWTKSKEHLPNSIGWISQPVAIAVAGIFVLVAAAGIAYSWRRRPDSSWQPVAVGLIALGYTVLLGVAWWMMTAKVSL